MPRPQGGGLTPRLQYGPVNTVLDWGRSHPSIIGWSFGLSLVLFVSSLLLMPVLIGRMRADYFVTRVPDEDSWFGRHRAARIAALTVKNTLGVILLVAGIAMLVLPGQGVITILVAITLLNFPGRRRLELRIIRQRHVRRAVSWIRERAKAPALIIPEGPRRGR